MPSEAHDGGFECFLDGLNTDDIISVADDAC